MSRRLAGSLEQLGKELRAQRPGIVLGTFRENDPDSDHDATNTQDSNGVDVCRAMDVMTYSDSAAGRKLAANLAAKLGKHPAMKSGAYVIFERKIMAADRLGEGWRLMEDRGSPTANHMDHVHVSVSRAQAGYDYRGRWGALFSGTGTGTAPTPSTPNTPSAQQQDNGLTTTSATAHYTQQQGAQNVGLGDTAGELLELVKTGVILGGALGLGVLLVLIGAARATRPDQKFKDKINDDLGDLSAVASVLPQGRAAGAAAGATAATKGASA